MIDEALQEIEELGLAEGLKKKAKQEEEKNEEEGQAKQENEEEVVILRRIDEGFEKWLGGLSEEKLEQVVRRLMKGHENEQATREYTESVKMMDPVVRFCSKMQKARL